MDDKNKPYKTLKELCKEAGLQPIPFVPVTKRVDWNGVRKTDRRPRRILDWACVCGWIGKKNQLEHKTDGRMHCPSCGGSAGIATFPTNGSVR